MVFRGSAATWFGAKSDTGSVIAIAGTSQAALFGRRDGVQVAENTAVTGQDLALSPIAKVQVSGTYTLPAGYQPLGLQGGSTLFQHRMLRSLPATGVFSFDALAIPDSNVAVYLAAHLPGPGQSLAVTEAWAVRPIAPVAGLQLVAPVPPAVTSPEADASVTSKTIFSWTAGQPGLYELRVENDATATYLSVWTTGTQLTLEDTLATGFEVQPGQSYSWRVRTYSPLTDLDAATELDASTGRPVLFAVLNRLADGGSAGETLRTFIAE
jgi:hypothetical protein